MKIAHWASRGARWEAVLTRSPDGYRLSERKHGVECGASFRPFTSLATDDIAKAYYQDYVRQAFDVEMKIIA